MSAVRAALHRNTVVVAGPSQVSVALTADASGETVILDLDGGVYYELNDVGGHVWKVIQKPCSVEDVLGTLLAAYEVPEEQCEQDLMALLEELLARGLIEIRHE